jgi:hypothetical protein
MWHCTSGTTFWIIKCSVVIGSKITTVCYISCCNQVEQKESPVEHEQVVLRCAEICSLFFWGFAETITEHISFRYRHSTCTTEHFSYSNFVLPFPWFQCPSCPAMLNQFMTFCFGGTLLHILLFWGYVVDLDESNEYEAWCRDNDWWKPNYSRETSTMPLSPPFIQKYRNLLHIYLLLWCFMYRF